jgi:hypothetical protein
LIKLRIAMLQPKTRHRLYNAGIYLGALLFAAAGVLKLLHHNVFHVLGAVVVIDPETGVVGVLVLAISSVARVHLNSPAGVAAALATTSPKVAEVIGAVEKAAAGAEQVIDEHPEVADMTVAVLRAELRKLGIPPRKLRKSQLQRRLREALSTVADAGKEA